MQATKGEGRVDFAFGRKWGNIAAIGLAAHMPTAWCHWDTSFKGKRRLMVCARK